VGRILDLLRVLGIERDTLVLFTSDNGSPEDGGAMFRSNGPLRGRKGTLGEGGLRVPMIARWPGRIEAGRVSDLPWSFADLLPTVADLAGARVARPGDGVSVAATLLGEPQDLSGRILYWERPAPKFQQAVRRGRWKAVRPGPGAPLQVFDLVADPGETRDVVADHPDVAQALAAALEAAREESPHWPDSGHDGAGGRDHDRSSSPSGIRPAEPPRPASSSESRPRPTTPLPKA